MYMLLVRSAVTTKSARCKAPSPDIHCTHARMTGGGGAYSGFRESCNFAWSSNEVCACSKIQILCCTIEFFSLYACAVHCISVYNQSPAERGNPPALRVSSRSVLDLESMNAGRNDSKGTCRYKECWC